MSIFFTSTNSFKGQLPNEKIVLLTRRHWLFIFIPLFFSFIFALFPPVIYFFINLSEVDIAPSVFWFFTSVYYLILWNLIFYAIMIFLLNTLIVTDKRIVENRQRGFFKHIVNELELDRVQDASVKVFGIFAEFLGYGNIEVQTAGATNKFNFTRMPQPEKIMEAIGRG